MKPNKALGTLLVLLGAIALVYLFFNQGNTSFGSLFSGFTKPVHDERTFSSNELSNIAIDSGSLDVNIVRGHSDEVIVTLEGRATKRVANDLLLKADQDGDTLNLSLQSDRGFRFGFHWSNVKLTVELPEKSWGTLTAKLNSGDIELGSSDFETVELRTNSGDIEVQSISASAELELKAISGDIKLKDITAQSIKLDTASGDVELERYEAETLKFNVGSGDVSLEDGSGALQGLTGSGDITLDASTINHDVDLKAGSGDILISLDHEPESLAVQFRTSSGDAIVRMNGFNEQGKNGEREVNGAFGSGEHKLTVRTGSGDIILR
ncbi:DUF4097 family beta strand repeat-containing protein [Paenibacillus agaridevorans]|uniref:DUF4097 family beta strand repeat-containing protein n=1 Tax=Paenibacillus agaridevorans TaxID=171404 RepID=UPI001BE443C6|nr:DUF4097 family beta strand repeat-containing protein [Paenibacillus agaridevorans]